MKNLILLIIFSISLTFGQLNNKSIESKFEKEVLREIMFVKNEKEKGIKSNIQIMKEAKNKYTALDKDLRVLCRIRLNSITSKGKITALGCEIKNETHNDIYTWIPIDKIEKIAELEEVLSIGSKGVFLTRDEVISAGVSLHKADLVHSTYGLMGNGIRVGVISDGMNHWQNSKYNGDLPDLVYAVDNTNDTSNYPGSEGTAMMEIIHDIAPNAELWFGGINNQDDPSDFANRVLHLKDAGCKVIVDDIGWIIGYSYFQENEISTAIKQFIQENNGCYISAAGNENGKIYSGVNYTVENDNFIKFNKQTNELTFTYNDTGYVQITLQWADNWYQPEEDYDLYIYDNNNQILDKSEKRSTDSPPEEYVNIHVSTSGSTYKIKVKWYDYNFASYNREIKIAIWGGNINMPLASTEKQIFGHPITSEVISTAATNVNFPLDVENFSSRGPAIVYSSGSGTILTVEQPKITGADNVETFVGQSGNFGNPFSGTSAAAPHIAGIAALYYEAFPTDSYNAFLQKIKSTSATMNDGGSSSTWNKASGFGRADAFSAIEARIAENYVNVTINQLNSHGINIGTFDIWQFNIWKNFTAPKAFVFTKSSTQFLRSNQSIIDNEKYHDWNGLLSDVTNYKSFKITAGTTNLTTNFYPIDSTIKISNSFERIYTNGGYIGFKDPWLIDTSDAKGPKNRGTISYAKWYDNLSSPFSPNYSSAYNGYVYKGVFLNQSGPPLWNTPYYSVRAPEVQDTNFGGSIGIRRFYFLNWGGSNVEYQNANALETGVVFKDANAVAEANLKGTQLSNSVNAFINNSQRRIVNLVLEDNESKNYF